MVTELYLAKEPHIAVKLQITIETQIYSEQLLMARNVLVINISNFKLALTT